MKEKLKMRKWKATSQLKVLIQHYDSDDIYYKYLVELLDRLTKNHFLLPSEYEKIRNWKVDVR